MELLLRHDSREHYHPIALDLWCAYGVLRRNDGTVIARPPVLTPAFLGPHEYTDGQPVKADDTLGHDGRRYLHDYRTAREEHPEWCDVIYHRTINRGGVTYEQHWLAWWFNDPPGTLRGGFHEMDIEVVQIADRHITLSQHRGTQTVPLDDMEMDDGRLVIYVARGSHALYPHPRRQTIKDRCDGAHELVPRVLVIPETGWPLWGGWLGDTRAVPGRSWESNSPRMPGRRGLWAKPEVFGR